MIEIDLGEVGPLDDEEIMNSTVSEIILPPLPRYVEPPVTDCARELLRNQK